MATYKIFPTDSNQVLYGMRKGHKWIRQMQSNCLALNGTKLQVWLSWNVRSKASAIIQLKNYNVMKSLRNHCKLNLIQLSWMWMIQSLFLKLVKCQMRSRNTSLQRSSFTVDGNNRRSWIDRQYGFFNANAKFTCPAIRILLANVFFIDCNIYSIYIVRVRKTWPMIFLYLVQADLRASILTYLRWSLCAWHA